MKPHLIMQRSLLSKCPHSFGIRLIISNPFPNCNYAFCLCKYVNLLHTSGPISVFKTFGETRCRLRLYFHWVGSAANYKCPDWTVFYDTAPRERRLQTTSAQRKLCSFSPETLVWMKPSSLEPISTCCVQTSGVRK